MLMMTLAIDSGFFELALAKLAPVVFNLEPTLECQKLFLTAQSNELLELIPHGLSLRRRLYTLAAPQFTQSPVRAHEGGRSGPPPSASPENGRSGGLRGGDAGRIESIPASGRTGTAVLLPGRASPPKAIPGSVSTAG